MDQTGLAALRHDFMGSAGRAPLAISARRPPSALTPPDVFDRNVFGAIEAAARSEPRIVRCDRSMAARAMQSDGAL